MAPINLTGTWKLDRSENFEDLLKAVDVGPVVRKMALSFTPTQQIEQNEDSFLVKISTPKGTQELRFKIGEEFEQKLNMFQGKFKCLAQWKGNVLAISCEPLDAKARHVDQTFEIVDGEFTITVRTADVVCKRIFKRTG